MLENIYIFLFFQQPYQHILDRITKIETKKCDYMSEESEDEAFTRIVKRANVFSNIDKDLGQG